MGKYMKKSNLTNINGSMEITEPTNLGVRTRAAKTLALKRLNSSSSASDSASPRDSSSYLQLRSRRLEKPPSLIDGKQLHRSQKSGFKESVSKSRVDLVKSDIDASGLVPEANYVISESSCGENGLNFESRHSTRESTPCNFGEASNTIVTPRSIHTTNKDYTSDRDIVVPTATELEEFFAYAEKQQQKLFIEKYNFDIVNDMPLTGRYEWVQVSP